MMTVNFTAPPATPEPEVEARVELGIDLEPPRQKRVTILFRFILAFPLLFVSLALSYVISIVGIAAWFAALFTKKVPEGLHAFMTSCLRVVTTTNAYYALLLPTWPGVPFDEEDEKWLSLRIDRVEQNRAAVFFRVVLAIPAYLLQVLLSIGQSLLIVIMWFVGIFAGRTPTALHQAVCAILRYSTRTTAYLYLLTPTQPWHGLFGDKGTSAPTIAQTLTAPLDPGPALDAPSQAADGSTTAPLPFAPPSGDPISLEAPHPDAAALPTSWVLTRGARRGIGVSIGLGSVVIVAYVVLIGWIFASLFPRLFAQTAVNTSLSSTEYTVNTFNRSVAACSTSTCIEDAAGVAKVSMTNTLNNFQSDWGSYSGSGNLYVAYVHSLEAVRDDFALLSMSTSRGGEISASQKLTIDLQGLFTVGNQLYANIGGRSNPFVNYSSTA